MHPYQDGGVETTEKCRADSARKRARPVVVHSFISSEDDRIPLPSKDQSESTRSGSVSIPSVSTTVRLCPSIDKLKGCKTSDGSQPISLSVFHVDTTSSDFGPLLYLPSPLISVEFTLVS